MPTEITQPELDEILVQTIKAYEKNDVFCFSILACLYKTGLRINEVLQVSRWSVVGASTMAVSLEKGDVKRTIDFAVIPPILLEYYIAGVSNPLYTYSAILWRINKATPIITINGDVRRSSAHLFRYNFIKRLYEEGFSPEEIKNIIEHKSQSSTNQYIFDRMYLH